MTLSYEMSAAQISHVQHMLMSGPRRARIGEALRTGLAQIERYHKTVEIRRGGASRPAVADHITSRTGNLLRSFRVYYRKGDLHGAYASTLPRARVLEHGATIVPRSGRMLAIPTRRLAVGVGRAGLWPRDWPRGTLFRPRGRSYLAMRNDAGGIDVMYHLVPSVTIPPRPGLERTIRAKLADVTRLVADAMIGAAKPGGSTGAQ